MHDARFSDVVYLVGLEYLYSHLFGCRRFFK